MYAETILQRFQPELSHHMLQSDDSCFLLQSNAWASDYRTTSEYDLGEDASIFTASELLPVENPIMELDPAVFSLSRDTIKISDIGSIPNDQLLDEVFGDCEDLLKDTRVEDAFPELSETVIPSSLSVNGEVTSAKVEEEQNPKLKAEEEISVSNNEKVTAGTPLQKSESSSCLSSMDWVNGPEAQTNPSFLGIPGMDLGAVFGMRRAYSEGDIQTLMNHLNVSLVHSPFERLIPLGDPKLEDRMQKLSRYRKKKTKRNFDRKIKYACRKALADSQPRIRGRFAKTEEGEMNKSSKAPST